MATVTDETILPDDVKGRKRLALFIEIVKQQYPDAELLLEYIFYDSCNGFTLLPIRNPDGSNALPFTKGNLLEE